MFDYMPKILMGEPACVLVKYPTVIIIMLAKPY